MEYIIVGCIYVCSVNHTQDWHLCILGAFTVEVEIGTRIIICGFYVSFCDRVASAGVSIDAKQVNCFDQFHGSTYCQSYFVKQF